MPSVLISESVEISDSIRSIVFPSLTRVRRFELHFLGEKIDRRLLFSNTQRIARAMPLTKRISRGRLASAQERFTVIAVADSSAVRLGTSRSH